MKFKFIDIIDYQKSLFCGKEWGLNWRKFDECLKIYYELSRTVRKVAGSNLKKLQEFKILRLTLFFCNKSAKNRKKSRMVT